MNNLIVKEYLGNSIQFKIVDGHVYANANKMAEAFGGRVKLDNWKRSENTKRYIEALEKALRENHDTELIIVKQGGKANEQGTWIHEKLILNFARYLNVEFELWCDEQIATLLREGKVETKVKNTSDKKEVDEIKKRNLEIRERYSRVKEAEFLKSLIQYSKSDTYTDVLVAESARVATGREILPLPKFDENTYTAEEVGRMLGITSNKVGRIANTYNLKNKENGIIVRDKAKHCNKEVEGFRYNQKGIAQIKKYI